MEQSREIHRPRPIVSIRDSGSTSPCCVLSAGTRELHGKKLEKSEQAAPLKPER